MSFMARPKIDLPGQKTNEIGLTLRDYEGALSTLCAGCGHDSVTAAINRQNLGVHITVHPIIHIRRNSKGVLEAIANQDDDDALSESYIRFAITRETDPEALERLQAEITKVLSGSATFIQSISTGASSLK